MAKNGFQRTLGRVSKTFLRNPKNKPFAFFERVKLGSGYPCNFLGKEMKILLPLVANLWIWNISRAAANLSWKICSEAVARGLEELRFLDLDDSLQAQSARLAEDEKVCPGGFSILRREVKYWEGRFGCLGWEGRPATDSWSDQPRELPPPHKGQLQPPLFFPTTTLTIRTLQTTLTILTTLTLTRNSVKDFDHTWLWMIQGYLHAHIYIWQQYNFF